MAQHNYLKLNIYNRSHSLGASVIKLSKALRPYRLAEQIVSSAISIASNIAEGSLRNSNVEFRKYLRYSSSSAAELSTQLSMMIESEEYNYLDLQATKKESDELLLMILKFHNSLKV